MLVYAGHTNIIFCFFLMKTIEKNHKYIAKHATCACTCYLSMYKREFSV